MPDDVAARAFSEGGAAVVTGGASGIGLAAARRFAAMRLPVLIADRPGERLDAAQASLQGDGGRVIAHPCDVARPEDWASLRDRAFSAFGHVGVLMLNAGVGANPGRAWENSVGWRSLIEVNFWGVVNGVQALVPAMLETARPGLVIVTGSKQGITTPPGNSAYNVSKAGLKVFTEALAYELRNTPDSQLSVRLLIPGFTFTGISAASGREKPAAAWTPEQVIEFMLERLERGDFYILCPDNDVDRATDQKRMQWAVDDIIKNRPALSRWHPDFKGEFETFMAGG
ncbi:MAG TPA: SDR family NAD(P)-dependent oxidoreductase [Caulobacteraceae bacterium]|nr:SDR family NAD(P)-dependent oxidoreductase [Caulobacteraceae bacterium]